MATTTTVSAWAKPGAWALDSEEHETEMLQQKEAADAVAAATAAEPSADFPSLAAAAATKTSKKKKGQKVSLAEFNSGGLPVGPGAGKFQVRAASSPAPAAVAKGLTANERLMLPTGPRERSEEELERGNSRGFGYSYGAGGGRSRMGGEDSVSRWDSSRASGEDSRRGGFGPDRDLAPSRADEIDDWGAEKRSAAPLTERRERSGGFFDSQSRADDSDSWVSNKSLPPPSDSRRMGDGFRERRGYDMFNREAANGGGRPDSESWGRRREDVGGDRPRLKLQPRTLPLAISDGEQRTDMPKSTGASPFGAARPREEVLAEKGLPVVSDDGDRQVEQLTVTKSKGEQRTDMPKSSGASPFGAARPREEVLAEKGLPVVSDDGDRQVEQLTVTKSKGVNPFGAARPREEVLAKKGQDWKEIDERLESMKVREATSIRVEGAKKGFGFGIDPGNQPGDQTERSWRKPEPVDAPPAPRVDEAVDPAGDDN